MSNKLINEKSPYLLQHANNPVNWFPWNEEAFDKAKKENKPIFLSIGYSTCHWCHVMEKESFEDEEVAKLLNNTFVCIKVDREERPDIDGIYMSVCQMITGSGGWPLTIIMTPEKKPFFAGTYFPKYNRFNRIGLMELIPKLKDVWLNRKNEVIKSAEEIFQSLNKQNLTTNFSNIDETILDETYNELEKRFDEENGGFGVAPKFPSPHNFLFLLRYWQKNNNTKALLMVEKTLTKMRLGGIYDHIGFGFARYSTDKHWLVPHFEKMLCDQAILAMAYIETYNTTKNNYYKNTADEIFRYVLRDLAHPEGGFYSAEDADSEGEEGKFYLWNWIELQSVLSKDNFNFIKNVFNISENGNWVDESKGIKPGTNILYLTKAQNDIANELNLNINDFSIKLENIRSKLFELREKRIHPHKDDKILTDWNALMISALCKAYQSFNDDLYLNAAVKSYKFIEKHLTEKDNLLMHRFRDGEAGITAYLDDYAFLVNALIDLYESTYDIKYLKKTIELNDILLNQFWDNESSGFYFTSTNNEKLLSRQKEVYDGAIPSGNSVALLNLIRLSRLTGNTNFETKANELTKCFSGYISRSPSAFTMFAYALDLHFSTNTEIVVVCHKIDKTVKKALELIKKVQKNSKTIVIKTDNNKEETEIMIPFTKEMKTVNDSPTFYICSNFTCLQPVNSLEELEKLINQ